VPIELKANQAKNELYSKEVNGTVIETVKYRARKRTARRAPTTRTATATGGREEQWPMVIIYSKSTSAALWRSTNRQSVSATITTAQAARAGGGSVRDAAVNEPNDQ